MRVILATGSYPPDIGGPATFSKRIEQELTDRQCDVVVVPFRAVRHLPPLVRHLKYLLILMRESRDADLIFAQDAFSVGLPARVASYMRRLPLVIRLGGIFSWEQAQQRYGISESPDQFLRRTTYPSATRLVRMCERMVLSNTDAIIVPSQYLKQLLVTWGIDAKRIEVVYNDVPESAYAVGEVDRDRFLVVSAGRFIELKRFDVVMRAVASVHVSNPMVHCAIYGGGPEEAHLRELIAELGAESFIEICPTLPQAELHAVFAKAGIFVLGSRIETLSTSILEAMAVGVPIIASNVGGIPEIIQNGVNGLLIPSGDVAAMTEAFERILSDESLARTLTENARERGKQFDAGNMAERVWAVLSAVRSSPH